jgi:D-arabinose 1-dehydrogenase-like Zn-dependent alcohol dehydrogenase
MKVVIIDMVGSELCVGQVAHHEAGPHQVLGRIESAGLCRNDLRAAHGAWPDCQAHRSLVPREWAPGEYP